ncbi:MAG: FecR domain-containing protein [Stagnimonas sp.]|nr:FecR domain-containing protein [Stagnimonas sp.]
MRRTAVSGLLWLLCSLFGVFPAAASDAVGQVVLISGTARSTLADSARALAQDSPIYSGETLTTASNSYLSLLFKDGARVLMRPNSVFIVAEYRYPEAPARPAEGTPNPLAIGPAQPGSSTAFLRFVKGGFRLVSGLIGKASPEQYRIVTPVATIGIRGTDISIDVAEDDSSSIGVSEGAVDVANLLLPAQTVRVNAGYFTVVRPLLPPEPVQANDHGESGNEASLGTLERAEDALVESAELPASDRYLAFAHPVLDVLENPAYASATLGSSGILSLAGSGYDSARKNTSGGQAASASRSSGHGLTGQLVGLRQISAASWLGLTATGLAARSKLPDRLSASADSVLETNTDSGSAGLLAAHRVGRWGLGLGASHYRSDLRVDQMFDAGTAMPVTTRSDNRITDLQLGAVREPTASRTLALGFTQQFVDSRTHTSTGLQQHLRGTGQVLELRWRQPLAPRMLLGSLLRARISESSEQVDDAEGPFYAEDIRVRTFQTGLGLGFVPNTTTAVVGDLTLGYTAERALQRFSNQQVREDEHDERLSAALHLGTQLHLPYHLLVTLDATQQFIRDDKRFVFLPGTSGMRRDTTTDTRSDLQARASIAYARDHYLLGYLVATGGSAPQTAVHNLFLIVSW